MVGWFSWFGWSMYAFRFTGRHGSISALNFLPVRDPKTACGEGGVRGEGGGERGRARRTQEKDAARRRLLERERSSARTEQRASAREGGGVKEVVGARAK
jgi:hypothetical protein